MFLGGLYELSALRSLAYLSLLFSGTLHSVGYMFPFLLCLLLLFFSLLFSMCKASLDNHLPSCISFSLRWFWSSPPVRCHVQVKCFVQCQVQSAHSTIVNFSGWLQESQPYLWVRRSSSPSFSLHFQWHFYSRRLQPTLPLGTTYDYKSKNEAMRVYGVEWGTKVK